ncbi:MAG: tetratricopeptide repeat protein, partial [Candidatus Acidiferrum sp.]
MWQLPVCLVGVSALACVLTTRAKCLEPGHVVTRELALARQNLSRADGDAEAAAEAAQYALDHGASNLHREGEANFLLGTARMRLAEKAVGEAARTYWTASRRALEEADRLGVSKEDEPRLHYRLGKVGFHTGLDVKRVVDLLAANADKAEDRAEAFDLLAQAYLRLPQPDYQKALDANTRLREVSLLRDDLLAQAKLRSGELKIKLGRMDEARKDLELIGPQAPAKILSKARVLRAKSYHDESKWAEASALWQAALADSRQPLPDRATVLYHLGVAERHLDHVDEAIHA